MRPHTTGHCPTGKLRYAKGWEAQLALDTAREARTRHGNEHVECRTYECPTCKGFHLTSQPMKTDPVDTPPRKPLELTWRP